MNNTFDFNRFSLLVKRQWVENKKLFLMASFGIMGIIIVINSLIMRWESGIISEMPRFTTFLLCLFFGGSIFANYVFKDLSDKNSGTSFLLIPASHFEKFLTGVFYAFIVFPMVFLTLHYAIDFGFVTIGNNIKEGLKVSGIKNIQLYTFMFESKNIREILQETTGFWLVIQAFILMGAAQFEGRSYIKTAFMGFAILFLMGFVVYLSDKLILGDIIKQFQNKGYSRDLVKPTKDFNKSISMVVLVYILPIILLVTTYFKLKEKQV
jgi:hypothetical protein